MDAVITLLCAICMVYVGWSYSMTRLDVWIDSGFKLSEFLLFSMGAIPMGAGMLVLALVLFQAF